MRFPVAFISLFSLQLMPTIAVPVTVNHPLHPRATPLPPTEDPFYVPPSDYAEKEPGAILRSRSVGELSFEGVIPFQAKAAYQLLFRTTDSLGNASAAVTTLIIPNNANTSRILSYQYAEDSAFANCAPSYTLQLGSDALDLGTNGVETIFVIAGLDQGWVVNVPDYEGLNSAFTSGIQAGQATLDSIRAALASGYVSAEAEYQMWGYSGGSIASEWAAELQESYAPELDFKGLAIGGVIPNVTSVLLTINEGLFAGLIPAGILGLAAAYPELKTYIDEHIIPSLAPTFDKALNQCFTGDMVDFAGQDMFSYFDQGEATFMSAIPEKVLNTTGIMGTHGTPQMPTFVYKAILDEVSPVADTDALVQKLCSQGADIQYVRDEVGEHLTEAITGSGDAFQFLINRFNGVTAAKGCTTTNVVTDTLEGNGTAALGTEVVDALLAILQLPVGDYYIG